MRSSAQRQLKPARPAYRTLRGWALGVLLEAHAIRECDDHGHMKDRTDPHAMELARQTARQKPFSGTTADQAVAEIDDVMASIGEACPDCG